MIPPLFLQIVGLLGWFAIGLAMVLLGRLSQRLGSVTHARPYHYGLYVAAGLVWVATVVRLYFIIIQDASFDAVNRNLLYTLLSDGLPAIGVTLGLLVTWYYWSWLLAERD